MEILENILNKKVKKAIKITEIIKGNLIVEREKDLLKNIISKELLEFKFLEHKKIRTTDIFNLSIKIFIKILTENVFETENKCVAIVLLRLLLLHFGMYLEWPQPFPFRGDICSWTIKILQDEKEEENKVFYNSIVLQIRKTLTKFVCFLKKNTNINIVDENLEKSFIMYLKGLV